MYVYCFVLCFFHHPNCSALNRVQLHFECDNNSQGILERIVMQLVEKESICLRYLSIYLFIYPSIYLSISCRRSFVGKALRSPSADLSTNQSRLQRKHNNMADSTTKYPIILLTTEDHLGSLANATKPEWKKVTSCYFIL